MVQGHEQEHRRHALVAVPIGLIVVVTVVDILAPPEVHLGPFLVAAPAVTASFAGPRTTGCIGLLAVLAQAAVAVVRTSLTDLNHTFQIIALILISVFVTFFSHLRERHEKEMTQLRLVAQAAQEVVLRPLPARIGTLRVASVYLAAEEEAQIGGDLFAAARTARGTRLIIGDVRGKGMEAVGDAALVLGAFRAAAHRQDELPLLVTYLEGTVSSDLDDPESAGTRQGRRPGQPGHGERPGKAESPGLPERPAQTGEAFITAALLDIPDTAPVLHLVNCGHPPPLLLRDGRVTSLDVRVPAPPLGLTEFADPAALVPETFPFAAGDLVLLYTDGVIEARDASGAFYPLAERVSAFADEDPQALLRSLRRDLLAHTPHGRLGDDAAMVAIRRMPGK
ncbi:PP2C family protein-serine/threonine phosphatase [Streptomyces lavendulocolor]|uniref:PP2C family protein-serine/threonine phosphatase n=1 Tax=Streptomyces lavendulocolor TaxID=67316 RepID=UPI003CD0614D